MFIKKTFKPKVYVLPGTTNLFGTEWIVIFNLRELPANSFCNKVEVSGNGKKLIKVVKFISDLKKKNHTYSLKYSENARKPKKGLNQMTSIQVKKKCTVLGFRTSESRTKVFRRNGCDI